MHVARDILADGFRTCLHSKYIAPASKNASAFLHDNFRFVSTWNLCYPPEKLFYSQTSPNSWAPAVSWDLIAKAQSVTVMLSGSFTVLWTCEVGPSCSRISDLTCRSSYTVLLQTLPEKEVAPVRLYKLFGVGR